MWSHSAKDEAGKGRREPGDSKEEDVILYAQVVDNRGWKTKVFISQIPLQLKFWF